MSAELLSLYVVSIVLVATTGLFYLLVTTNLIRAIIGLELVTKSVTVGLILAGKLSGNPGLAQTLVITLIVVEVVVMVVATGLVLVGFQHTGKVDVRNLRNLKG
jgi:multisubunit Na+/H+ antiporter MnhC subunit